MYSGMRWVLWGRGDGYCGGGVMDIVGEGCDGYCGGGVMDIVGGGA